MTSIKTTRDSRTNINDARHIISHFNSLQQLHITMVASIRSCNAPLFSEILADSCKNAMYFRKGEALLASRALVLNKKFRINTDDMQLRDKGTRCESYIR